MSHNNGVQSEGVNVWSERELTWESGKIHLRFLIKKGMIYNGTGSTNYIHPYPKYDFLNIIFAKAYLLFWGFVISFSQTMLCNSTERPFQKNTTHTANSGGGLSNQRLWLPYLSLLCTEGHQHTDCLLSLLTWLKPCSPSTAQMPYFTALLTYTMRQY